MKTVFLKISNTEINVNETDTIPIVLTNIPTFGLTFNTVRTDIFWEVEIMNIDKVTKELYVKVIDYNPINHDSYTDQRINYQFNKIRFDLLDWQQVEPQLSRYQESAIKDNFFGMPSRQEDELENNLWSDPVSIPTQPEESIAIDKEPNIKDSEVYAPKRRIEEVLRINIKDFQFHDGLASTTKDLKYPELEIRIVIHNPIFLQQFEYIKEYFIKHLGRKTVQVFIDFDYDFGSDKISYLNCVCPDLEGIDDSVIAAIKIKRTNILKNPSQKETKSVLDLEELFHILNDHSAGINVFDQSEKNIIDHFINIEGKRNKQQLSYLANDLYQKSEKIRFTINPIFGFVFSYKTINNNYFIWELLNTHATYIWFAEKSKISKDSLYSEFEQAIEYIKALGREDYKKAYKERKINSTIQFRSLTHKRSDVSGFIQWREKLKSILE